MGSDDIFKKRKKNRVKRKHDFKTPHANSFLIVTEGTKTEPIYFNAIKNLIQQKIGGKIDIRPFIDIQGQGKGCSPKKLIDITDQVVKTSKVLYQNIWIVFDRDEFEDFDDAIKEGIKKVILRGAINVLNTGFIYTFITAILLYIVTNGMLN